MTQPDIYASRHEFEAEWQRFVAWVQSQYGFVSFDPEFDCDWKRDMWRGFIAGVMSEREREKSQQEGTTFHEHGKWFNGLVEECRREERAE